MSWMQTLYDTYENCKELTTISPQNGKTALLPVSHTLLKAHITVRLNEKGDFLGADVAEDINGTVAPCTEASESRSGTNPPPHPLFDKLQYLAGDYYKYVDESKRHFFKTYITNLEQWCNSEFANKKVVGVLLYLKQEKLIADLVDYKVLYADNQNQLITKWNGDKENIPELYKIKTLNPKDAIVRFSVNISGDYQPNIWLDTKVQESFIQYIYSRPKNIGLCYVSGREIPIVEKHQKNIVSIHANAKLISANDSSGFTYRGRFNNSSEAISIGEETSVKAFNALRWLVKNRGFTYGSETLLAWGTRNEEIPKPISSTSEFDFDDEDEIDADVIQRIDAETNKLFSNNFRKAIMSYKANLKHSSIAVMALDSATPGRLSIAYYRELRGDEYIEALERWHTTCIWNLIGFDKENKSYTYVGAPSLKDISEITIGKRASDKLKKATLERLLSCVVDGAKLPDDIVNMAVSRASRPETMENYEWEKTLRIACALFNKKNEQEGFKLSLEENRDDRDYLYGRLLAVADEIEGRVLYQSKENRDTNAKRLMNAFSQRPFHVWKTIEEGLVSYQRKLKSQDQGQNYEILITKLFAQFKQGDFENNLRLSGTYLLGFHCQQQVFYNERIEASEKKKQKQLSNSNNDLAGGNNNESE